MDRTNSNFWRQNRIETTEKTINRNIIDEVHMGSLSSGVNTRISTTGPNEWRGTPTRHRSQGLFERTLNRATFGLALPTLKATSKICHNNLYAISHPRIVAWKMINEKVGF